MHRISTKPIRKAASRAPLQELFVTVKSPLTEEKEAASLAAPSILQRNRVFGTGEMARLTRAFDWSRTPIGPIEEWPSALLVTANTMLPSRHPIFLWWGKEL